MNGIQLEFNLVFVIFNVIIRVITALLFIAYLMPLLIREATVKNGLKKLRFELLFTGSLIFIVNTSGLWIIFHRYFIGTARLEEITNIITVINTFGFLLYAITMLNVYTHKYTPENKKLHEKFDRIEKKIEEEYNRKKKKKERKA